jgi:hypothetical protein
MVHRNWQPAALAAAVPSGEESQMFRFSLVVLTALVAAVLLVLTGPAAAAPKVLKGTVGPGSTISLTRGGKSVTSLKAGVYRLNVSDKSSSHNFHLSGPGVDKVITSASFQGKKSVTVKLKRGTYRYACDPHTPFMAGSFLVS